jgi:hypothetical protein
MGILCCLKMLFDNGRIAVYEEGDSLKWHVLDQTLSHVKFSVVNNDSFPEYGLGLVEADREGSA